MSAQETWNGIKLVARQIVRGAISLDTDVVEKLAELYEQYLHQLPDELREAEIIIFSSKGAMIYKRSDIPRLIREDKDFRELFLRRLGGE